MAEGQDSFMAEMSQFEDQNNQIFSFITLEGDVSPLSSPFLQTDDSAHFTGSDLSSPDSQTFPGHFLYEPTLDLLSHEMELQSGMIPVLDSKAEANKPEEKKAKKGRGKKRQRNGSNESTDVSAVVLSREQILTFSSEDLDQFTSNITTQRPLTYAEEKELKRQRRLIKNRESAQASRQRKKQYIDELEAEIAVLKGQNGQLTNQVGQLVVENRNLKEELQQLHTLVKKTGLFAETRPLATPHKGEGSGITPQQKAKAGVCLLILLFSFGLFFNTERGLAKELWGRTGSVIPQVIESMPAMAANGVWGNNNGRKILEADVREKQSDPLVLAPQPMATARVHPSPIVPPQKSQAHKITINDRKDGSERKRQFGASIGGAPASSAYEEIHNRRSFGEKPHENQPSQFMAEFAEMMNESINSNVSELHDAETQQWFSERLKARPNTAFFSVTDFQQIIPPNTQPFDSNSPFFVSLLIPARSLVNQLPASSSIVVDDSVIEVTCHVVAVNQTNLNLGEMNKIRQVPLMA